MGLNIKRELTNVNLKKNSMLLWSSLNKKWRNNSFSWMEEYLVCVCVLWLDCRKVTDISINVMLLNFSLHSISPACDALLEWNLKGTYLEQYNCSDTKNFILINLLQKPWQDKVNRYNKGQPDKDCQLLSSYQRQKQYFVL